MGNLQKFIRGQVWWQKPTTDKIVKGIQNDGRPVVLISNNAANRFSPAVTVIPLTTATKKDLPTHVKILMEDGKTISTALCEQIRTISTELLTNYIGTLDDTKMTEIEIAILTTLGFKQPEIQKEIELPTPETTILIDSTPTITLNAKQNGKDINVPTTEEETETKDYAVISSHNRAKKFSKREKEMILRYLGGHTIADTAKYFAPIYGIDYKKMYTRVCNIKNRNKK